MSLWARKYITATTTITPPGYAVASSGEVLGFYVSNPGGGSVTLYDGTSISGEAISGAITPTAIGFNPFPAGLQTGLHVVITGTLGITVFWK